MLLQIPLVDHEAHTPSMVSLKVPTWNASCQASLTLLVLCCSAAWSAVVLCHALTGLLDSSCTSVQFQGGSGLNEEVACKA